MYLSNKYVYEGCNLSSVYLGVNWILSDENFKIYINIMLLFERKIERNASILGRKHFAKLEHFPKKVIAIQKGGIVKAQRSNFAKGRKLRTSLLSLPLPLSTF